MSKKVTVIIAFIIGIGLGAAGGTVGLLWATGNIAPSQSAGDVAPTLSLNDATPTPGVVAVLSTQIADLNSNVDNLSVQLDAIADNTDKIQTQVAQGIEMNVAQSTLDAMPTNTPLATETPMPTATDAPQIPQRALYRITADESEVRFRINEILMGNPTEVIGASNQVAGDFIVNFSDPAASQLGEIAINARTLKTDNEFRDQSLRGQILQTGTNEFIRFVPTELLAMPTEPVAVGDTVDFDVVGELSVKGTTNTVTFNVSVTIESEERMTGFASVTILYADFGINIQTPPSVSGVEDTVILEIDFVALAVEE